MRDLGTRLLIGLAAVTVGIMAVGYAFIYGGVAAPSSGLGTLAIPPDGEVIATLLDDGRPVFASTAGGATWVLDAREPREPGELDVLLWWCLSDEAFIGTRPTSIFGADGSSLRDADGMTAHETNPADGDASRVRVEAQTAVRPAAVQDRPISYTCESREWIGHSPQPDEIFDPSVAIDAEPPGWTWLEGTLLPIGNQVLLCDGLGAHDCPEGAVARGINPATVPREGVAGLFLGSVHDGGIEGLIFVPDPSAPEAP